MNTDTSTVNRSLQWAARVAGLSYLLSLVFVIYVNFAIHDRLIVTDNPSETARNIQAHDQLFRIGIVGDLLYCACTAALAAALYVILATINKTLSLLAAIWRIMWVLMWLVMTLRLFDAVRLYHNSTMTGGDEMARLQDLAILYFFARFDYYYVGLLFGSLASTVCGYLWLKSRYVPRGLALFGLVSSAWCVICTVIFYVFPHFDSIVNLWWFDTPMALFELTISFWLIIRGLKLYPAQDVVRASA
jgi:hypothetical protein